MHRFVVQPVKILMVLELLQNILFLLYFCNVLLDLPLRSILLIVLLRPITAVIDLWLLIRLVAMRVMQTRWVKLGAGDVEDVLDLGGMGAHGIYRFYKYLNRMINIKLLQEYLGSLHTKNPGVVNNIFLANS